MQRSCCWAGEERPARGTAQECGSPTDVQGIRHWLPSSGAQRACLHAPQARGAVEGLHPRRELKRGSCTQGTLPASWLGELQAVR